MDVTVFPYPPGDPVLIDKIVNEFLSQGKFDKLRKECMADADTKPAYQNLQQRVESTVSQFLRKQVWKPDLNKNQLRDSLRKHILESGFLDAGINRIVDQIVNPNVLATVFMPEVEEVVYSYLSIPRPTDKIQRQNDLSVNFYPNVKSKELPIEEPNTIIRESDKEELKRNQKIEEGCRNTPAEKLMEDALDKSNIKISQNSPPDEGSKNQADLPRKDNEVEIKTELEQLTTDYDGSNSAKDGIKSEAREAVQEDGSECSNKFFLEKMEPPSDESQESLSRMGVERLRISESDGINAPDSDASLPLEINEKSMSDSRDSDDSIMNKMSPISQGRLTPEDMSTLEDEKEEKKPLTFIGRIPKIKRDDSESSKSSKKEETPKRERLDVKSIYSSDESDSSKQSFCRSDSDDKKPKDKKRETEKEKSRSSEKSDKKYDGEEKKRKGDHRKSSSSDNRTHSKDGKDRDDKSRSRRDEKDKSHSRSRDGKRNRSRDKNSSSNDKRSSSSSHSRSKSSSHQRNVHKSDSHDKEHHRDDSKSRDKERIRHDRKEKDKRDIDKRKREEEKRKKSKNVDDHSKERNKRDDRRSTDRDSNERERDKTKDSASSRPQSESKKKEREHKAEDTKKEKNQREESDKKEEKTSTHDSKGDTAPKNLSLNCKDTKEYINGIDIVNATGNEIIQGFRHENVGGQFAFVQIEGSAENVSYEIELEEVMGIADPREAISIRESKAKEEVKSAETENVIEVSEDVQATEGFSEKNSISDDSCEVNATREDVEASLILDYDALHKEGVLTKVQFPKVIDDFYVKFDSTGFRYFEDWETTKLDCEEEFKEYVDEAEKDLSLLSDDGSDYESHDDHSMSEWSRREIVTNSLNGIGNFEHALMFHPGTYEFYRWKSGRFYKSYRKNNSLLKIPQAKIMWPRAKTKPTGEHVENTSSRLGEMRPIVADPSTYDALKVNGLTDEDEIHGLAEKNKENHERNKKMRKNFRLLNRYRRKIGLTFKHGKEQHKFVCRRKKRLAEKHDVKAINGINCIVNEHLRDYINQTERLDGSGVKGKGMQGSHDLREWNSIRNISSRMMEPLRLEGAVAGIRNQDIHNMNSSFKSKLNLYPSERSNRKILPRRLAGNERNQGVERKCDNFDNGKKHSSVLDSTQTNGFIRNGWYGKKRENVIVVEASDGEETDGENSDGLEPQIVEVGENCYVEFPDEENEIASVESTEETLSDCGINRAEKPEMLHGDEITVEERLVYETNGKWEMVEEDLWKTGRRRFGVGKLSKNVEETGVTGGIFSVPETDVNSVGSEEHSSIDDDDGLNRHYSKSSMDFSLSEVNSSRQTPKMDVEAKIRLYHIQSMRRSKSSAGSQKTCILARISSARKTDSEEEEVEGGGGGNETSIIKNVDIAQATADPKVTDGLTTKTKKRGIRLGLPRLRQKTENMENGRNDVQRSELKKKFNQNFIMPLSPESDDSVINNDDVTLTRKDSTKSQRKRTSNAYSESIGNEIPQKKLKDCKRALSQKYESQDLYKPRPFSVGSKTRSRSTIRLEAL